MLILQGLLHPSQSEVTFASSSSIATSSQSSSAPRAIIYSSSHSFRYHPHVTVVVGVAIPNSDRFAALEG